MFASVKNNLKRNKFVKLLSFIVSATQSEAKMAYVPEADAKAIKESEPTFVEINESMKQDGNIAIYATAAGVAASQQAEAAKATKQPEAPKEKPVFVIEDTVPLPVIKRGGGKVDIYPFAQLQPGQSFLVPATADRPNPAKSLASTVSSATKRYKNETPARKFIVRPVDGGARIWRTV